MKTYWIDCDVNGVPHINDWKAKNKLEAIQKATDYYVSKGNASRDIIIRQIKQK